MIKVVYHRAINRVSITGHAKSGESGHDLVCASASILAYTLASFVQNMKDAGQIHNATLRLTDGDALISCKSPSSHISSIMLVFDTICGGFELLARDYPDNISYERI